MNRLKHQIGFLLLCIPCFFFQNALAQRVGVNEPGPKGQIMVYGSLDYSQTNGPGIHNSQFSTSPSAGIPIGVGYFLNNNDILGVNFAFSQSRTNNISTWQQYETGIWYSPSMMIGKNILLIAQFDAQYVWGQQPSDQAFHGYRLRAYPMIGILLGHGWALKFKFGELSMLSTKVKHTGWTNNMVAGLSGATFGTGISKNSNFKSKR